MIKCIAIGNRIMGDDGIGIQVLDEISVELEKDNIEVIISETDIDYGLSKINDGDILYIIDSTYFNITPGTVTFTPIEEAIKQQGTIYSQHQPSLINLLGIYKKSVKGYVIGIEVEKIHFSINLSQVLNRRFCQICEQISEFILRGI